MADSAMLKRLYALIDEWEAAADKDAHLFTGEQEFQYMARRVREAITGQKIEPEHVVTFWKRRRRENVS